MKSAHKIAVCGIITALSVAIMFCTSIFPIASYAIPAFCGALIVFIVLEMGCKQALLVYVAVSFISFFLIPDRDASMAYILLLGYYPIIKSKIEQLHFKWLARLCKAAVFMFSIALIIVINGLLVGWEALLGIGSVWIVIGSVFLIAMCFLYDICLTLLVPFYYSKIRPVCFKRFFH